MSNSSHKDSTGCASSFSDRSDEVSNNAPIEGLEERAKGSSEDKSICQGNSNSYNAGDGEEGGDDDDVNSVSNGSEGDCSEDGANVGGDTAGDDNIMSKNKLKRMLKEERWKAKKLRKKQEKQMKRTSSNPNPISNRIELESGHGDKYPTQSISAGIRTTVTSALAIANEAKVVDESTSFAKITSAERREIKKQNHYELCDKSFDVIIDCCFEQLHSEATLKSLCQQIAFCHGFAHKHKQPSRIFLTGIGNKMIEQLKKSNFSQWIGTEYTKEDYINHPRFESPSSSNSNSNSNSNDNSSSSENNERSCSINTNITSAKKKKLVYLTGDSEVTLTSLDPDCAYIIGGIVDRNMHKGATFDKATRQNIPTAKFPIREHCDIVGTHILTVNHVFEILLNFAECNDWSATLMKTLPTRKTEKHMPPSSGNSEVIATEIDTKAMDMAVDGVNVADS